MGNGEINVWLVNTGWTGGGYGVGNRMELTFTRAMIKAALNGALDAVPFKTEPFFGLSIPTSCPDVPNALLNPRDTWPNEEKYDQAAKDLAGLFRNNFAAFADQVEDAVIAAGPQV